MKRVNLNLELMTVAQMKEDNERMYNPAEWIKKIDRFAAQEDVQFYKSPANDVYKYDRFWVSYTLRVEGIRLFNEFGYTSCVTNHGFCRVEVDTDTGDLLVYGYGPNGEERAINDKSNHAIFAQQSKHLNYIFSTNF